MGRSVCHPATEIDKMARVAPCAKTRARMRVWLRRVLPDLKDIRPPMRTAAVTKAPKGTKGFFRNSPRPLSRPYDTSNDGVTEGSSAVPPDCWCCGRRSLILASEGVEVSAAAVFDGCEDRLLRDASEELGEAVGEDMVDGVAVMLREGERFLPLGRKEVR